MILSSWGIVQNNGSINFDAQWQQRSDYCDDKKTRTETISCTIENGVWSKTRTYTTPCENHVYGTETYSDWSCTVSSCNAGYEKSWNSCVKSSNYCDSAKTRTETISCSITNGVWSKIRTYTTPCNNHVYGTETYSDWSCSYTCNTNYTRNGSSCVGKTLTCGWSAPSSNVDKWSSTYTYAWSTKDWTSKASWTLWACEWRCKDNYTYKDGECKSTSANISYNCSQAAGRWWQCTDAKVNECKNSCAKVYDDCFNGVNATACSQAQTDCYDCCFINTNTCEYTYTFSHWVESSTITIPNATSCQQSASGQNSNYERISTSGCSQEASWNFNCWCNGTTLKCANKRKCEKKLKS